MKKKIERLPRSWTMYALIGNVGEDAPRPYRLFNFCSQAVMQMCGGDYVERVRISVVRHSSTSAKEKP